jgi:HEAT repeat protein
VSIGVNRWRTVAVSIVSACLVSAAGAGEPSFAEWIADLRSADKGVANDAWRHLRAAGEDALPALVAALEHADETTSTRHICRLLNRLGPNAEAAVPAIEALLPRLPRDREYLAVALAGVAPDRARANRLSPVLVACASAEASPLQALCRDALIQLGGPASIPFLIGEMHAADPEVRAWAARMAHDAPPDAVREALADALRDRVLSVRVSAAYSLVRLRIDEPDALTTLLKGVCHGPGSTMARVATTLDREYWAATQAEDSLVQAIRGTNENCRIRSAVVLAYVRPNRAVPAVALVRAALRDGDDDVRDIAATALSGMGEAATAALPDLDALRSSPERRVRESAALARSAILNPGLSSRRVHQIRLVATAQRDRGRVAAVLDARGFVYEVKEGQRFLDGCLEAVTADGIELTVDSVAADYTVDRSTQHLRLHDRRRPASYGRDGEFTGEPLSIDFEGDITTFAHLVAGISGINVFVEPGTSGRVQATASEQPWDRVVVRALEQAGLGYRLDGNYMRIAARARVDRLRMLSTPATFSGQPVTLRFLQVDAREFEKLFSEISGLNICFPEGRLERITMIAQEAPWDEVFELILISQGWTYRIDGPDVQVQARAPSP